MCLDFANHLATNHGKVLYCAIEEGFGYTLKEKIERLKANHPNLFVTDRVPEHLDQFQFVFIDSVSKAGLEVSDMDEMVFLDSKLVQDAVCRNIEIIGEASNNILRVQPSFAAQHAHIPWQVM